MEWRKNLYQFEATPTDDAWENIKKELETDVPKIRELFDEYTAQPPAQVWNAISSELDRSEKTPVIWYLRPYFVTAAAASIAGIVFLYTYFFAGPGEFLTPDVSASVYKPAISSTLPATAANADKNDSFEKRPPVILQPAMRDIVPFPGSFGKSSQGFSSITQPDPASMAVNQDDENYIYLVTNSGEVKRVSYKLEKMITEIRRQDGDKIRRWTDKLEHSAFIPAGDNFFDIAEMIKIMGEDRP
jgi:hypothetical protein